MPPSQIDQVTALQKRLAALAPSVAPQPLPRVLAAAGNASGGDGALAALQALCTSKRQRRAMESAVLAVRASCTADVDDDGAGAISLYGRLDLGRGSFDVHGARLLPALDAGLRSLSSLLEALSAAAHADDERDEVAEMVRRFAEANGHKAPLAAPTSSSSSSSSRDGGATVLPPSPLLQETVTVAYALQVLIRSAPGLRVTLCGVATPLGATVDVRALVEKLFAAGRQAAAAAAAAGEDGEDGDEGGGRKKKGKRSKQKRGRGGGDGDGGGGGSAAWDLDAAEEAAEEEAASQDTAEAAGGDAGKKRKRRKKSKKSAE
jgi:hypothetical protein